jgi:hypothetical protein
MMARRWLIRLVSVGSIAIALVATIIDAARGWPSGGFHALYAAVAAVFIVVGWLIAERRPSNAIGPLLVTFGALFAWYLPADLYLHLPGDPPAAAYMAVFVSILDAPMLILVALVLILFPDGRPPTPRWRWTIAAGAIGILSVVVGQTLQAGPLRLFPDHVNPLGLAGFPGEALVYLGYAIMLVLLVAAAVALVVRWRRGTATERAQIKWVVAATVVLVVTEVINVATFQADQLNAVNTIAASIGIALVPVAMGIAILRYRLYDIDRIISRTIAYAIVTGVLVSVFAGAILLLQAALSTFTQGQTVAVAASTLAVFALFQPVRRRVQRSIDRRFDRAKYDADVTIQGFSHRLRADIDLDLVRNEIARTANAAVRPTAAAIWLRGE